MAVVFKAEGKAPLISDPAQPDRPVAVEITLLNLSRIGPRGRCKCHCHKSQG
jgi:hypothetical protein